MDNGLSHLGAHSTVFNDSWSDSVASTVNLRYFRGSQLFEMSSFDQTLIMRCYACCLSKDFDLSKLYGTYTNFYEAVRLKRVLALNEPGTDKWIFCFHYGAIVFWGFNESEERDFIANLTQQLDGEPTKILAQDLYQFTYHHETALVNDEIALSDKNYYTKLAAAYALSQSVKLKSFEDKTEQIIAVAKSFPDQLATLGHIPLSRRELPKRIGQLLKTRHSINLHLELLNTPIFFWDNPEYEQSYLTVKEELEIEQRLVILNQRLNVIQELLEMLDSDRKHKDSLRLEWAIVWLIVVEVLILLAKEVFKII